MDKQKKTILIIVICLVLIAIAVTVFFVLKNKSNRFVLDRKLDELTIEVSINADKFILQPTPESDTYFSVFKKSEENEQIIAGTVVDLSIFEYYKRVIHDDELATVLDETDSYIYWEYNAPTGPEYNRVLKFDNFAVVLAGVDKEATEEVKKDIQFK